MALIIRVLILPKFEIGEMCGDFPGEAQYYYEAYCKGGEAYEIAGGKSGSKLYVKDGVALYVTGAGKVNAALSTAAVLSDRRFDFSDCHVISVGCAGSAFGTTVMGDVFVITAAVDYDLGHHADARDLNDKNAATWYYDKCFDDAAVVRLNTALTDRVYDLVKDVRIETTDTTRAFMAHTFQNADWAVRNPMVLKGTTITGDNYWKGLHGHDNALLMVKTYNCPDPYALTEMEDVAVGVTAARFGFGDRFLIIRASVNMDVFMNGATPDSLWNPNHEKDHIASENGIESADIFAVAMKNNFAVGSVVIDAILNGTLYPL